MSIGKAVVFGLALSILVSACSGNDLDVTAPRVSRVDVTPSETSADVVVRTDELSRVSVEYGETTAYEGGSVDSTMLATAHTLTLFRLVEDTRYHYRITLEDRSGNRATGADSTFRTLGTVGTGGTGGMGTGGAGGMGSGGTGGTGTGGTGGAGTGGAGGAGGSAHSGAFRSDDFRDGVLDPVSWEVVDPLGDGTVELLGAGTPDAHLLMTVPAGGLSHDAWTSNTALRVMQPAADDDFEIEVKFESEPTKRFQDQGLLVEQDASNFIRFDVFSDGSDPYVFAATFVEGLPVIRLRETIPSAPVIYLRLRRSGDQWTARYSFDGSNWTTATSFSHALSVSSVGVYVGNATPNPEFPAPGFTAVVDYFFETGSPIDPEDPLDCVEGEQFTVDVSSSGPGTVVLEPTQSSYDCGETVTLTAEPDAGAMLAGWGGALRGTANPTGLTVASDTNVTASFVVDTFPPEISNVSSEATPSSATIVWNTHEVTTGLVEYGRTTSYELGAVASSTPSTAHRATLNGLLPAQSYYYRVLAEDAAGNAAMTGASTLTTASASGAPTVDVWYGSSQTFGALGEPQTWVNVLGQVYDPDGLSVLTYSLNGGPEQNLSVGPFRRLAEPGDFNVELDFLELAPGNNTVEIRAVDRLGFETNRIVTVNLPGDNVWPLPYEVDWSTAAQIDDVAQIVDGRWSIMDGALTNDLERYDRIVAIGDVTWTDYEVTVPVTVKRIDTAGFGGVNTAPAAGVLLRWPGHTNWTGDQQPSWGYYPLGGGAWVAFASDGTGELRLEDFTPGGVSERDPESAILLDTTYIWKVRVTSQADGSSLYQVKTWVDGAPEPADWQIADSEADDVPGGSVVLIAHFADVRFGNVVIAPL